VSKRWEEESAMHNAIVVGFAAVMWAASASAASPYIACSAARSPDERAVCRSTTLVQMDAEMATLYRVVKGLVGMGQRGAIQDDQADWLRVRRACGASFSCLRSHYAQRIADLDAYLDEIRSRGPF
jgi:uncharacterized protein